MNKISGLKMELYDRTFATFMLMNEDSFRNFGLLNTIKTIVLPKIPIVVRVVETLKFKIDWISFILKEFC